MNNLKTMLRNLVFFNKEGYTAHPDRPSADEMDSYFVTAFYALIPCMLLATYYFRARLFIALFAAFIGVALVEIIVAAMRKRPISGGAFVYAMMFALFAPSAAPAWMIAVSAACGTLFGCLIFGGAGRNLVHPVALGKAFLVYGFPQTAMLPYFGSMLDMPSKNGWIDVSIVMLVCILVFIIKQPDRFFILLGIFIVGFLTALAITTKSYLPSGSTAKIFVSDSLIFSIPLLPLELRKMGSSMLAMWHWGGLLFAMTFLVIDPAITPRGIAAKIIYGAVIGCAAVFMRTLTTHGGAVASAVILGALVVPLIAYAVNAVRAQRRAA
ncbi:MAG: RnfABCDGE type electron transport complex subunit D [Spirochaetes bacterium]|nr:RnfABCDGE type electron transport complex subunit D [Spirochaetota bacterium]